tara:strand:+ start:12580 stop:13326 length:747 start_codon:yes stop_codon:yes gene_type:complete
MVAMALLVLSLGWQSAALAAETAANANPVDFRACNFRDGKDELDLAPLLVKFRNYANQKDVGYAAWILKPEFHSSAEFDIGWLGSWPDGIAYGTSMERWKKEGKALAAEFNSVVDCSARHELAMALPINAPDGTPEDGILLFYACNLNEGKSLKDAYKAQLEFGLTMKANGSLSVSWMYTPAAGAGPDAPDYYHVVGFYRYSDLGDTMELFVNRGGVELRKKIVGPVASCQNPNIYDALSVRARDETT